MTKLADIGDSAMPQGRPTHHGSAPEAPFDVAIVIVSYARPEDVMACVRALVRLTPLPTFDVFISENGGRHAFDQLKQAFARETGAEAAESIPRLDPVKCVRQATFTLRPEDTSDGPRFHLAEIEENLGYAGGVNAWLKPLLQFGGWRAAWVLNPDTEPEPDALSQLDLYSARERKGMVGSRLVFKADRTCVQTRGLSWNRLRSTVIAVDSRASSAELPDITSIEDRLDAPSGASIYATRELIEAVGPMKEHYFLYFEDLEWGVRAKRAGYEVGYANSSVVRHEGGSTIGTAWQRRDRSRLSVYLDIRNRLIFVREHYPFWLPWMFAVGVAEVAAFAWAGSLVNSGAALDGLRAGLLGETGRPAKFSSLVRR